jgi:hypothetical protein
VQVVALQVARTKRNGDEDAGAAAALGSPLTPPGPTGPGGPAGPGGPGGGGTKEWDEAFGRKDHLVGAITANTAVDHGLARDCLELSRISLVFIDLGPSRERIADGENRIGCERFYVRRIHADSILAGDQRAGQICAVPPAQQRVVVGDELGGHEGRFVSDDIYRLQGNSIPEPKRQLAQTKRAEGCDNGCDDRRYGLSRPRHSRLHCSQPGRAFPRPFIVLHHPKRLQHHKGAAGVYFHRIGITLQAARSLLC